MATMAAGFAATTVTAVAIGRLLAHSEAHRDRAMAAWAGAVGTVLLDSMAAGAGATASHDGIDCGGFLRSIGCVVANVEQYEARYPLLYLWRRHEADTGGPGERRGGVGVGYAVVPHGVERIDTVSPHFAGTTRAESAGIEGGFAGAVNRVSLVRGARRGRLPAGTEGLAGGVEPLPGVTRFALEHDDVLVVSTSGGGGFGDPLDREPEMVAADVRGLLVTRGGALHDYGVVVGEDGVADIAATMRERDARRRTG
jgi:N-methylhydantoinase B